nr:PREDICTED: uromodulin-like 1 [Anolis carolinensis]|eukprot:XP_016852182.1 PREDICTED: uromodulin-like 1 [Anolis carolinensis]
MRLQPASRGGSFLAQIVLHDNRSRPTLSVESCCVTPTARPTRPESASCCHFPRSLLGCRHVQIHQNSKSSVASFAIQLFQMLNHSVAYLHCELSVCLTGLAGCEEVR